MQPIPANQRNATTTLAQQLYLLKHSAPSNPQSSISRPLYPNSDSLALQPWHRNKEIMRNPHIPNIRLHQLKPVPPKQHPQREIQLRPRESYPQTRPSATPKRHHEALERDAVERGAAKPALGREGGRVRKDGLVVRHVGDAHAHARACWDHVVCIPQRRLPGPWVPCAEAVAKPHSLEDTCAQIRHVFKRKQV
jgi:hypothetical protein